jgi:hypothetical protein
MYHKITNNIFCLPFRAEPCVPLHRGCRADAKSVQMLTDTVDTIGVEGVAAACGPGSTRPNLEKRQAIACRDGITHANHEQPVAAYNRVGYCSNFQLNR